VQKAKRSLIADFIRDEAGGYIIAAAVAMPTLTGLAALGTEAGLWLFQHRTLQGAADSAAITAAIARYRDGSATDLTLQASSVLPSHGVVPGVNQTSLVVNNPPRTGTRVETPRAVEVIISHSRARLLSAMWAAGPVTISARAVAIGRGGKGCVLALNPTAGASASIQGNAGVVLNGCGLLDNSNHASAVSMGGTGTLTAESVSVVGGVSGSSAITTSEGIATGQPASPDPYADTSFPSFSGCTYHNLTARETLSLNPGVYCGGLQINAGAQVTMTPGIYYINGGDLTVNGGATLAGSGVTLVFTSSSGRNYPGATINGGATINLSAPTSGPTAGIVIFGDQMMTLGTRFRFEGGATQNFTGAVYVPGGDISFAGGASSSLGCTQLIGNTISFSGNSNFALECEGVGTKPIASALASLVE
jgi:hypothetical protein